MHALLILNHIFFLLQCRFLAKIIGNTINLCNFRLWKHSGNRLNVIIQHYKFNTFIAMFLIISEIYLFLFRTHVNNVSSSFSDYPSTWLPPCCPTHGQGCVRLSSLRRFSVFCGSRHKRSFPFWYRAHAGR